MSTSDQQGNQPLTRKQLREIRLTGATPVIGEEEAAAAAAKETAPASAVPLPRPAQPADVPPAPAEDPAVDTGATPLTRRQARAQERVRTASVPVVEPEHDAPDADTGSDTGTGAGADTEPGAETASPGDADEMVSAVPSFAPVPAQAREAQVTDADTADAATADDEASDAETAFEADVDAESEEFSAVFGVSPEQAEADDEAEDADGEGDELPVADAVITGERPIVSPTFGTQLTGEKSDPPSFSPSFDELITSDSGGSHRAPNTLIFTHPGEGSLSGPVASTGEVLVTGSYELPRGIGSQGHAHGAADGKDVDAVLIDGELPPSSSPTPIAASSAVSTVKPAGEVIRPPAPEKGNKLMLILAITAGGLALALAVALIVAFTTNVF